jgi:peroxiredoxin
MYNSRKLVFKRWFFWVISYIYVLTATLSSSSKLFKIIFADMRHTFLLTLTVIALNACGQSKSSRVTVIFFDNQSPKLKVTVDTLFKRKEINLSDTPVDIFFTCKNFHLPYYVPTNSIFKNSEKDKECDMKIYPKNVKCYEYDKDNRVSKMNVSGSGTMNNFSYTYNHQNQIKTITDIGTKFTLNYNAQGMLSELKETDGIIDKRLVFIYE